MPDWLDPKTATVASLLKQVGYATAHIGKWHLGGGDNAPTPDAYGFDFVRHTTGNKNYWEEGGGGDPISAPSPPRCSWMRTIKFIKENKDRPFYANLWTLLPARAPQSDAEAAQGLRKYQPAC